MKLRCLILEDEPLALERLQIWVEKVPFLHLQASFDEPLAALAWMQAHPVDLLLLDIHLGEITGIQLLEMLQPQAQVILTTASPDYALRGYELRVTDYLLKPYTFERFLQAVTRALEAVRSSRPPEEKTFIFVKTENRLEKVLLREILYIEGMRDYRRIHLADRRIMTLQTFGDFEAEIPPQQLCRVHKSWMVAPDKIGSIERDRIRIGEVYIPISETYKKAFFEVLNLG